MYQHVEGILEYWLLLTINIISIYYCLYLIQYSDEDELPSIQEISTHENQDSESVTDVAPNGVASNYQALHPYTNTNVATEYNGLHGYESVSEAGTGLYDRHYIEIIE